MDWSIQETARLTGTTSRTLRHYDAIGLLSPSSRAAGGSRHYDEDALVRLQRILLLRELGLPLGRIAEVLETTADPITALEDHVRELGRERARLERQIAAVTATMTRLKAGEPLMAEEMFDGFDHREHEDEVRQRWGDAAYETSEKWWNGMNDDERRSWRDDARGLAADWATAAEAGVDPDSPEARDLSRRHIAWLTSVPGTPAADPAGDTDGYVRGLAEMYVADPRFAANYGGRTGAEFVRAALVSYLDAS
jgi:DNA-binding transcriptional MerR regulator